ncbi:MAG: glycosyltransferase family 2 protein [Patescibacteria group bacterium]|jgi:GT2 family glycosyltransferase
MQPFVDVIVVLWKSAPFMEALFQGLATLEYPHERMTVHIVDNSPGDGSLDEVKRQMEKHGSVLPPIELHEPGMNTGFSGGNNLAMKLSMERGHEYSYLLNHDAAFEPGALREIVTAAEADPMIGSAQSLLVLQQNPDEVNSTGNAIHFLGFGYCAGYHEKRSDVSQEIRPIGYASGAGVLYPNRVLKDVGLLDETLFAYHEDLDLGWRIMLAGYKNVLVPKSVSRHRYEFSRSIAKWFWMERNRAAVLLKNYHWATILLLLPQLIAIDIFLLAFAISGGWWREKLRATAWFFKASTWRYIWNGRKEIARTRKVPDSVILKTFTPVIAYQEFESPFVRTVANPLFRLSYRILSLLVRW